MSLWLHCECAVPFPICPKELHRPMFCFDTDKYCIICLYCPRLRAESQNQTQIAMDKFLEAFMCIFKGEQDAKYVLTAALRTHSFPLQFAQKLRSPIFCVGIDSQVFGDCTLRYFFSNSPLKVNRQSCARSLRLPINMIY